MPKPKPPTRTPKPVRVVGDFETGLRVFTSTGEELACEALNIYWEAGQPVTAQVMLEATVDLTAAHDTAYELLSRLLLPPASEE